MDQQLAAPTLREVTGAVRRHTLLAAIVAVIVAAAGAWYLDGPDSYSATARIEVRTQTTKDDQAAAEDKAELERLRDASLQRKVEGESPGSVTLSVSSASGGVFNVTAAGEAGSVVGAADHYARVLVERRREELKLLNVHRVEAIEARLSAAGVSPLAAVSAATDPRVAALLIGLDAARVEGELIDENVRILNGAVISIDAGIGRPMILAASGLMGLLAGLVAPFVLELLRGRVMDVPDLQRLGPYPVLDGPSEATPVLVRLAMGADPSARPLISVSPVNHPGTGELARQLASHFSEDATPILVWASPGAGGAAQEPGLLGVLKRGLAVTDALTQDAVSDLAIVPLGDGDPHLLSRPRLGEILQQLLDGHSPVVVAGPPLITSEGQAVAAAAGRVLVTFQAGVTKMSDARCALERLEASGTIVVGLAIDPGRPR